MEQDDLDVDMAQLEINERKRNFTGVFKNKVIPGSPHSSPDLNDSISQPRRSSRKKIRPQETEKRRVLTKPKKLLDSSETTINEIHNYYLDKRVKRLPPSLETIFEEPKGNAFMSTRKFKRCVQFNTVIGPTKDKLKVKKRSMKAKKIGAIKRLNKNITLELLKRKLSSIEDSDEVIVKDSK